MVSDVLVDVILNSLPLGMVNYPICMVVIISPNY